MGGPETLGWRAYDAYRRAYGLVGASADLLPPWRNLTEAERACWEAFAGAAHAMADSDGSTAYRSYRRASAYVGHDAPMHFRLTAHAAAAYAAAAKEIVDATS